MDLGKSDLLLSPLLSPFYSLQCFLYLKQFPVSTPLVTDVMGPKVTFPPGLGSQGGADHQTVSQVAIMPCMPHHTLVLQPR